MRTACLAISGLLLATLSVAPAGFAADKPKLPAAQKPAPPADGHRRLADDLIDFIAPPDWQEATKSNTPTRSAFVSAAHDAMMSVEVLPATMEIKPDLAADMVKKMRQTRKANGQKWVQEPTIEKDERFIIRIRERYEIKDKIADQLHLYRQVGPRVVLVTVNSLAGEEKAKGHHEVGETASLSAEYTKAPPKGK